MKQKQDRVFYILKHISVGKRYEVNNIVDILKTRQQEEKAEQKKEMEEIKLMVKRIAYIRDALLDDIKVLQDHIEEVGEVSIKDVINYRKERPDGNVYDDILWSPLHRIDESVSMIEEIYLKLKLFSCLGQSRAEVCYDFDFAVQYLRKRFYKLITSPDLFDTSLGSKLKKAS